MPACLGFDADGRPFDCGNQPGTRWSTLWCPECDERRRQRLSVQFAALAKSLEGKAPADVGENAD